MRGGAAGAPIALATAFRQRGWEGSRSVWTLGFPKPSAFLRYILQVFELSGLQSTSSIWGGALGSVLEAFEGDFPTN